MARPLVALLERTPAAATGSADVPFVGRRIVAFDASGREVDRTQLATDVFALAARFADDRGKHWLVRTEDGYRIAVVLLAASVAGARIALPPNLQPGTLEELSRGCDRIFADASSPPAPGTQGSQDPLEPGARADASQLFSSAAATIDRHAPLVDLFTSGTSGPGKRVTKALCHLEDEVAELEQIFAADAAGPIPADARILATASAHHLYGLLLRVLWPLATGRAFCRDTFLLPDEILARASASGAAVVVSTPAHLRHLSQSARATGHAHRIARIFSSGGPLETTTALALERGFGAAPIEIFGSTETGGVASRRASAAEPDPCWTTFPSVRVCLSPDGRLSVTSPFVTLPEELPARPLAPGATVERTMTMGDRAELSGSGFRLLGRGDRIVKVGEKTLSLPDIERHLAEHEMVAAAVAGTYPVGSGARLGAVVVLSRAGLLDLARHGRRAVQHTLAEHLAARWNRVALPRRWRFVSELPSDARGKLAQATLEAQLARPLGRPREPLVLAERREGADVIRELVVPADLAYFDGHYDAFPLVPGAVQIHWVMLAVERVAGRRVSAQRMEAIKFRNVLRPADLVTMRLAIDDAFSRVTFTLADGSRVFSSGRIALGS